MSDRAAVEHEIRHLLATERHTVRLSNALFGQFTGLFWKIATTQDERRALVDTPLYREAQARVREFQYRDADALARAAGEARSPIAGGDDGGTADASTRAAS